MDTLDRIEPVARDLMRQVDAALVTLGAPAGHPVWSLLRTVATTPADAVAFLAGVEVSPIRTAAEALRVRAERYGSAEIPLEPAWRGAAGEAYHAQAVALRDHLAGDPATGEAGNADGSLAGRLRATAAFADEVADWYERSRQRLARTLAEVLTSAQAVELRSHPDLAGRPGGPSAPGAGRPGGPGLAELASVASRVPPGAVLAAADVGAYVLQTVADAVSEGRTGLRRWGSSLTELPFRPPAGSGPGRFDATIHVHP